MVAARLAAGMGSFVGWQEFGSKESAAPRRKARARIAGRIGSPTYGGRPLPDQFMMPPCRNFRNRSPTRRRPADPPCARDAGLNTALSLIGDSAPFRHKPWWLEVASWVSEF